MPSTGMFKKQRKLSVRPSKIVGDHSIISYKIYEIFVFTTTFIPVFKKKKERKKSTACPTHFFETKRMITNYFFFIWRNQFVNDILHCDFFLYKPFDEKIL